MQEALVTLAVMVTLQADARGGSNADRLKPHMAVLGVALERTTLAAAMWVLGNADRRFNGGDAAASADAICYAGNDGTVLVLQSNAEMGGSKGAITDYQLVARIALADFSSGGTTYVPPPKKRPTCARSIRISQATQTAGGLRLGMRADEVKDLLGSPAEASANYLLFSSDTKRDLTADELLKHEVKSGSSETARTLRIEFENGRTVAIRANQETTAP